jgi:plasmid stabilization system protein ParE
MRIRYSPRAFADREAIFAYLEERSPQGARKVKRAIIHSIRLLASHPYMAPPTDVPGVRELSIPRHAYKIYYRIERDEIWLIHIRDARRKPWQRDE